MWYSKKTVTINVAHHIRGVKDIEKVLHGHTWRVSVFCMNDVPNIKGNLVNDEEIEQVIFTYNNIVLNELPEFSDEVDESLNPTPENLAYIIAKQIPLAWRVVISDITGDEWCYEQ